MGLQLPHGRSGGQVRRDVSRIGRLNDCGLHASRVVKFQYSLRTLVFFVPFAIDYYPCVLFGVFLWISAVMPLAFLTDCSFTNKTEQVLWITPIGTVGVQGSRHLLPLYRTSFPFLMKSKLGFFRVPPGETFRFTYDMDDINFSELVVEDNSGQTRQIVANANPTAFQYIAPKETDYVLDDFDALQSAPDNIGKAARIGRKTTKRWFTYGICSVALAVEGFRWWRLGRRRQTTAARQITA